MLSELGLKGIEITQSQYKYQTNVGVVIVDAKSHGQSAITALKFIQQELRHQRQIHPPILALVDCCQSDKGALFELCAFDYFSSPLIVAEFKNRIGLAALHNKSAQHDVLKLLNSSASDLDLIEPKQAQQIEQNPYHQADFLLADKTARYLKSQLRNEVRLNDLVRYMGTNKNKLRSAFRACFGTTLFNWLAGQRLQCAARLLATSSLSIVQIAEQVGYSDSNNFSTAFKRVYRLSPSRYRQSIPNKNS